MHYRREGQRHSLFGRYLEEDGKEDRDRTWEPPVKPPTGQYTGDRCNTVNLAFSCPRTGVCAACSRVLSEFAWFTTAGGQDRS